jgi:ATP-binding cassette subfamily B protein
VGHGEKTSVAPTLELARIIVLASPRRAALAALLMLLSGALPSAAAVLSGHIIGQVVDNLHQPSTLSTTGLVAPMAGLAALFVLQQLVTLLRVGACEVVATRTRQQVSGRLMRAMLAPRSLAHMEDPSILDQVSRVRGRGWMNAEAVAMAFMNQQTTRLQGIAALILIGRLQPWLAPILFAGFIFRNFMLARAQAQLMGMSARRARALRGADYVRDLALHAPAAKELRVFGLAAWLVARFEHTWLAAVHDLWRQRPHLGRMLVLGSLPLVVAACVSVALMAQSVAAVQVGTAELMVYGQALAITFRTMGFFSGDENTLEEGLISLPALQQLERTLRADTRFLSSGNRSAAGLPGREVVFEGVHFRYPGQQADVLKDLTLRVDAGTSTAIVGENGAGKTTLIKLLARLYEPTGGQIRVDGIPLSELDPASWQRQTAALFQDFQRYGLSVTDNIAFGQLELRDDRPALELAASQAQALGLIQSLPRHWETLLSRQFTSGVDLSGGEWQRIALARALLAASHSGGILILDEPTAHLDVRGEAAFYDRFLDLTRGQTTVIISHRFSTVRRAKSIAVLHDGQIVEHGSHDELIAAGGRYARLFQLQAGRFADSLEQPVA